MTTTPITFISADDVPQHGRRSTNWDSIADQLRANPGRWALVKKDYRSTAASTGIKRGSIAAFRPAGTFDARTSSNGDGTYSIYARFIGEG